MKKFSKIFYILLLIILSFFTMYPANGVLTGMDTVAVLGESWQTLGFPETIAGLQSVITGKEGVVMVYENMYAFAWNYGNGVAFAFIDLNEGPIVFRDWNTFMQSAVPKATGSVKSAADMFEQMINWGYKEVDPGEVPMKIVAVIEAAAQSIALGGLQLWPTFILFPMGAMPEIQNVEILT